MVKAQKAVNQFPVYNIMYYSVCDCTYIFCFKDVAWPYCVITNNANLEDLAFNKNYNN